MNKLLSIEDNPGKSLKIKGPVLSSLASQAMTLSSRSITHQNYTYV